MVRKPRRRAGLRPAPLLVLATAPALLLTASACSDAQAAESELPAVREAFAAFQRAVLDGDREAFFAAVTPDLLEVADRIDVAAMAEGRSEQLLVRGIDRLGSSRWHVHTEEPDTAERATFVVVRHGGRLRVDVVASVAATGGVVRHGRRLDTETLETRDRKELPGAVIPEAATAQPGTGFAIDADRR